MGSGSHVMACVLARQRGWPSPRFAVCDDFAGLRNALAENKIHAFLWEHFTTRPYQLAGDLSFAGEVSTPWGCFCAVIANPPKMDTTIVRKVVSSALNKCRQFQQNSDEATIQAIQKISGMTSEDAKAWHSAVRYAHPESDMSVSDLELARETVKSAGLIKQVRYASVSEYLA